MAVKIINHDKHVGNNFDALRESVLCSNVQHPNVVMTYKVGDCLIFAWLRMGIFCCLRAVNMFLLFHLKLPFRSSSAVIGGTKMLIPGNF